MEKTRNLEITKELFVETIEAIEKQYRHDKDCAEANSKIFKTTHIHLYNNSFILNQLMKLLQLSIHDYNSVSIIDYYMWQTDFGKDYKKGDVKIHDKDFELRTASDLWEYFNHFLK